MLKPSLKEHQTGWVLAELLDELRCHPAKQFFSVNYSNFRQLNQTLVKILNKPNPSKTLRNATGSQLQTQRPRFKAPAWDLPWSFTGAWNRCPRRTSASPVVLVAVSRSFWCFLKAARVGVKNVFLWGGDLILGIDNYTSDVYRYILDILNVVCCL